MGMADACETLKVIDYGFGTPLLEDNLMAPRWAPLLALVLSATPGATEESADDRAFAAALQGRLRTLALERQNCGHGVYVANDNAAETLDKVERRYNSSNRGDLTTRERGQLRRAQENLTSAIEDAAACEKRTDAERVTITALLSNPAQLHLESERLRNALGEELLALLADVRAASAVLSAQSSYDEFGLKMDAVGKRLQIVRYKYEIALRRGDHKALGAPISDACSALYAALGEWKQVQITSKEVASTRAAVARAAAWEAEFFQRQWRAAQLKQADAQRRFAERRGTALALVQGATRVAEATAGPAVTVRK